MLQSPCGIEQVTTLRVRDALLAGLAQFPRLLAACRAGDTLMVTKLDRLARSLPDASAILDEHTKRNIKLSVGRSTHDPTDPVGRLLFKVLAMMAEFASDLNWALSELHPGCAR